MISNSRRANRPHAAFTLVRCASQGMRMRCSGSAKDEMLSYVSARLHCLDTSNLLYAETKKIVCLVVFILSCGLAGFTRMHHYSEIQSRGHLHDKQTTTDFRISRAGFIR